MGGDGVPGLLGILGSWDLGIDPGWFVPLVGGNRMGGNVKNVVMLYEGSCSRVVHIVAVHV